MVTALQRLPAAMLHIPLEKSGTLGMLRTCHIHSCGKLLCKGLSWTDAEKTRGSLVLIPGRHETDIRFWYHLLGLCIAWLKCPVKYMFLKARKWSFTVDWSFLLSVCFPSSLSVFSLEVVMCRMVENVLMLGIFWQFGENKSCFLSTEIGWTWYLLSLKRRF